MIQVELILQEVEIAFNDSVSGPRKVGPHYPSRQKAEKCKGFQRMVLLEIDLKLVHSLVF